jgi:predicted alpha/beta superfamily hydrolase
MVHVGTAGPTAPCIYLIDAPEHPTPLDEVASGLASTVVCVPVANWRSALTPWPAEALYRGEGAYAGKALETLEWLLGEVMPSCEQRAGLAPRARAIAGYSLAGLFSLYAWLREQSLAAVACLSGSLWYEGWLEYMTKQMESTDFPATGRYAYLSLGSKERRGSRPQLKAVQDRTEACVELLRAQGLTCDYVLNPGGHLTRINERTHKGLLALDSFLTK